MKTKKIINLIITAMAFVLLITGIGQADTPAPGEEDLFTTSTAPDALILLDLSGSMDWNPAGGSRIYGASSCAANTTYCTGSSYDCSGGFCNDYGKTNCTTNCSRLAIAKRAIFSVLDDNNDGTINTSDRGSLGVRIGYMRYYDCSDDDTGGSYTSGCNQIAGSGTSRRYIDSLYSQIYCNSSTSCTVGSTGSYSVGGASATGGTPLASALREAKLYLDSHKAADAAKACRQKFVILLTDGADTYACSGDGSEDQDDMYQRRRESVAKAQALADAGYRVFVIGFGAGMPRYLQNTLNWMGYYGGTDNPNTPNTGSVSAYDPAAVTSCGTSSRTTTCNDSDGATGAGASGGCAASNDPATAKLTGYAFIAADADQLATAMKTAINIIREATYSFSQASVQSSRTTDENFLYEGSFQPVTGDPFWLGHLKKYQIDTNGEVALVPLWDAGTLLQSRDYTTRAFHSTITLDYTTLGVATAAEATAILGYLRGNPAYNPDNWKLGDVFRSTPITVGAPSAFFDDIRDANNAFATHRTNNNRTSALGNRLIVAGANDGQFHAFKTSDGSEAWTFLPSNLLSKLKNISHATDPTSLAHQYFVDGPVTVADVWLGNGDGTSKSASDWKTILVFGEGRGSNDRIWSSSSSCNTGLLGIFDPSVTSYCGYYALNVTSSLSPAFMWNINSFNATSQAPYMGESWSKMMTGRVRINVGGAEKEKWVGFIGGGYAGGNCASGGACDTRGKGFFVIDLSNGAVLWSYTMANNINMVYSVPAQPAEVDTDNDGFIDTVYVGDMGGNMWRFKLCLSSEMPSCGTSNWSGGRLYNSSSSGSIRPVYTSAAVAKDGSGNFWVYWGTGDKTDPTHTGAQDYFYALKDDRSSTRTLSDLTTLTGTQTYDPHSTYAGFRTQLSTSEKDLADPTVFGGVVYFTTFTPSSTTDPCDQGGDAYLYAINYTTGGGALPGGKSTHIGTGIPSAPVLSLKPGTGGSADLYVTVSGGGGTEASTKRINFNPPGAINRANMLYWRDQRIQ